MSEYRAEQATIAAPSERAGEQGSRVPGWWAITDRGARLFVPASAVAVFRTLRTGQRVLVDWRPSASATPPHAKTPDAKILDAEALDAEVRAVTPVPLP